MLPLPPSTNSYWRSRIVFSKEQQRHMAIPYTTDEAKNYIEDISERIMDARCRYFSKQALQMTVIVCPRDARRQDISNRLKGFEDALKEAKVFEDDSQMVAIQMLLGPKIKQGRVVVFLSEVRIDVDMILTRALSVKYVAPSYQEPVLNIPAASPQSGDLFAVDEVRDEPAVRHPARRRLAGPNSRRSGGDQ